MRLINLLVHSRIKLQGYLAELKLQVATIDSKLAQEKTLISIISNQANTEYGKKHQFNKITNVKLFRKYVPINDYESLRPWIEKQDETSDPVINAENAVMYATTSGTTGKPKFIPILKKTLDQQRSIQNLFIHKLIQDYPGVFKGRILGITGAPMEGLMPSGVPYGSTSGQIYVGMPKLVHQKYVVPPPIVTIENYDLKYLLMLRLAINYDDITYISTANPSTLVRLAQLLSDNWDTLINDIEKGGFHRMKELHVEHQTAIASRIVANPKRAYELKELKKQSLGHVALSKLWPNIKCIGCWTGGSSGIFLSQLRNEFPESVPFRDIGYLASEFRGTTPFESSTTAGVPTLTSNYYEFVERDEWDADNKNFLGLHELKDKSQYYIFVTTDCGLYRYHMHDIVEVEGFYNNTPKLKFLQKGKGVTNITGEKVFESQLIHAIKKSEKALGLVSAFYLGVADEKLSKYFLYYEPVENQLGKAVLLRDLLANLIDSELKIINSEYEAKRNSQRLKDIELICLKPGTYDIFKRTMVEAGQRESQFKIVALLYAKELEFDFDHYHVDRNFPISGMHTKTASAVEA